MNKLPQRKSIRLKNRNYSQNGLYFVTFCTHNKNEYLGRIVDKTFVSISDNNNEMILSQYGKILNTIIGNIEMKYENVLVDCFCIMPNHVHMIIAVLDDSSNINVGAAHEPPDIIKKALIPKIIGYIKMNSAKQIRLNNPCIPCAWQRGYYDHIIRNGKEHQIIMHYIKTNQQRWLADVFYPSENV